MTKSWQFLDLIWLWIATTSDFWLSLVKQLNDWQKPEAIHPEKLAKFPNKILIGFWIRSFVRHESHEQQALKYKTQN